MRRARHSRTSGREQAHLELFGTGGLEADPVSRNVDLHFSMRPFASEPSGDGSAEPGPADGTEAERFYQRAGEAARRGRWTEAIQLYRELLVLEPGHAGAHNNLALLLERAGEPAMALDELSTALRYHPDQVELLVNRGAIRAGMKQYDDAEADLRRAIRLVPSNADAHFNLGMVYWRRGLPDPAADAFRRALDHDETNAAAWYYLGEALNHTGDHAGAQFALERSAHLEPNPRTFHMLGRVFDRMHRPTEALEMYRQAREIETR